MHQMSSDPLAAWNSSRLRLTPSAFGDRAFRFFSFPIRALIVDDPAALHTLPVSIKSRSVWIAEICSFCRCDLNEFIEVASSSLHLPIVYSTCWLLSMIALLGDMDITCIMHADDLILLSASLTVLQNMIYLCKREASYLSEYEIKCMGTKEVDGTMIWTSLLCQISIFILRLTTVVNACIFPVTRSYILLYLSSFRVALLSESATRFSVWHGTSNASQSSSEPSCCSMSLTEITWTSSQSSIAGSLSHWRLDFSSGPSSVMLQYTSSSLV